MGVDPVRPAEVRAWLDEAVGEAARSRCRHLVTLNPEYVMAARRDKVFAGALAAADLVTADGVGIVLGARLLGGPGAGRLRRITGLDVCEWLAGGCARHGAPLFLLGAREGAAGDAAAALGRRFPALSIAGTWEGGSPGPEDDAATLARIAASGARAVLVAYGAPGQVLWIERNRDILGRAGVRVAVGVGGAFDMLAGRVPRAPGIVRRVGLEWLYRLVREPWRWRRQLALPRFAVLVLGEAIGRRRRTARG